MMSYVIVALLTVLVWVTLRNRMRLMLLQEVCELLAESAERLEDATDRTYAALSSSHSNLQSQLSDTQETLLGATDGACTRVITALPKRRTRKAKGSGHE